MPWERSYILVFLGIHVATAGAMLLFSPEKDLISLVAAVFVYTSVFYVSQGALRAVTTNELCSVVDKRHHATALSIMNMPGFWVVGGYGLLPFDFSEWHAWLF